MSDALQHIAESFVSVAPAVDYWSLRLVEERSEALSVRQGVLQPPYSGHHRGAMVTVLVGGAGGYAATADLSPAGLRRAAGEAVDWARAVAGRALLAPGEAARSAAVGDYASPVVRPWASADLEEKLGWLQAACAALQVDARIVDSAASLAYRARETLFVSSDGARLSQQFSFISPGLVAVANAGSQTQRRTGGGADTVRQGGLEQLEPLGFPQESVRVAEEAIALLEAPECPDGARDLLLMPRQMVLQIHESIGHPLELDRILGDERNYAGTSFVTPEMFGSYAYGSPLLNVTFDPGVAGELASYGYDDEGTPARREYLIREGILQRALGGVSSQARAGLPGVANARACDWDRPPIDRMANLNLEPGASSLDELIASVERGVLMDSNRSWSIDDSRNKFQFGCEYARLIEDGVLGRVVRNPNYRGISAEFWRSLDGVGGPASLEVRGVANCGKGEPNQVIQVGHASPPCLFRGIEVFGGAG
jgi:predicted Zn-dependent protease